MSEQLTPAQALLLDTAIRLLKGLVSALETFRKSHQ